MKLKKLSEIRERFVLVDFQNTLWKSWMVRTQDSDELTRKDGYPTGHVFRLFRTLLKWKGTFAGHLVICYEGGEKYRYELFPEYKAGRRDNRKEFDPVPDAKRMMSMLCCTELMPVAAEADDAIAAYIQRKPEAQHLILSSDKDLWALLGPRVQIVSFRDILGDAEVKKSCKKHYGTSVPRSITMAKALYGDNSDNLPRVPRLLKKHMASLLEEAETPDEFFANLDGIPPKTVEKLRAHEDQVRRVFSAVKLRPEVKLRRRVRKGNPKRLRSFLREFECESLLHQVDFMTS
jgi:DNA polymerase-1